MSGYGSRAAQVLPELRVSDAHADGYPAGSMRAKVAACVGFVCATGNRAVIGALEDVAGLVAGSAGTTIRP
ncbi:hypothetical protein [Nocardioides sp. HB32]